MSKIRQDSDLGPAGHGPYDYGSGPGGYRPPHKPRRATRLLSSAAVAVGGNRGRRDLGAYQPAASCATSLLGADMVRHSGARPWILLKPGTRTLNLTSNNGGDTGKAVLTRQPPCL